MKAEQENLGGFPATAQLQQPGIMTRIGSWLDLRANIVLLMPAVLVILFLSIFPLFVSFYLSLSRSNLGPGGFQVSFWGTNNYQRLLFGSEQRRFLGRFVDFDWSGVALIAVFSIAVFILTRVVLRAFIPEDRVPAGQSTPGWTPKIMGILVAAVIIAPVAQVVSLLTGLSADAWMVLGAFIALMLYMFIEYLTSERFKSYPPLRRAFGISLRVFTILFASFLMWLSLNTLTGEGLPGTLIVTLVFVFGGVSIQYLLGLGLAMLVTQDLPGKRFFRVVFLLPMMITPVGIAFLFRMITDTLKGPAAPIWSILGLSEVAWVDTAEGARLAVLIGDTWQWTPFMFIILLAALEGVSREPVEAAMVDGANRWQMFRYIILPAIIPVSTTVILIRLIEAFKIIDIPNILTRGGPGTATESVSLYAYITWRSGATSLGMSAASAYLLLFVVTFVALIFVNSIRRRLVEFTV